MIMDIPAAESMDEWAFEPPAPEIQARPPKSRRLRTRFFAIVPLIAIAVAFHLAARLPHTRERVKQSGEPPSMPVPLEQNGQTQLGDEYEYELCIDEDDACDAWASAGECQRNSPWMHMHCPLSCALCKPDQ